MDIKFINAEDWVHEALDMQYVISKEFKYTHNVQTKYSNFVAFVWLPLQLEIFQYKSFEGSKHALRL